MKNYLALLLICLVSSASAQNFHLDPSYGTDGFVKTDLTGNRDEARDLILSADGKLSVVGIITLPSTASEVGIVRYNNDGSIDTESFGLKGFRVNQYGIADYANGVALDSSGRIIAVGNSQGAGQAHSVPGIFRLNTNGTPDSSFGLNGRVGLQFGGNASGEFFDVHALADGRYLATGLNDDFFGYAAMMFKSDGTPDANYGIGGSTLTTAVVPYRTHSILLPNGKLLIIGTWNGGANFIGLARFLQNGKPDSSFGTNGFIKTNFDVTSSEHLFGILRQKDGKILIASSSKNPFVNLDQFSIVRIYEEGKIDSSFGKDGFAIATFASDAQCASIVQQPNGSIIAGGVTIGAAAISHPALAKFDSTGKLDAGFGTAGMLVENDNNTEITRVIAPDNHTFYTLYPGDDFMIRRYTDQASSVPYISINSSLQVSPNPARNSVTVTLPNSIAGGNLEIIDLIGRKVEEVTLNEGRVIYNFDLSNVVEGLYNIVLLTPKGIEIKKMLVAK